MGSGKPCHEKIGANFTRGSCGKEKENFYDFNWKYKKEQILITNKRTVEFWKYRDNKYRWNALILGRIAPFDEFNKNCKTIKFHYKQIISYKTIGFNELNSIITSSDSHLQGFIFLTELKGFKFFASTFLNLVEAVIVDLFCYFLSYFPDELVLMYRKHCLFVLVVVCCLHKWRERCCLDKRNRRPISIDGEAVRLHLGRFSIVWDLA